MARLEANLLDALFDLDTPIRRAVFLTYSFDPTYFADAIYPELQRRGCERTLILMDVTQYQLLSARGDIPGAGRVILERFPRETLFHPKVFVLAGAGIEPGTTSFRCVIGSANLTRHGFEEHRELFSLLTEETGDTDNLIELLCLVADRLPQDSSAERTLRETIAELQAAKIGRPVPHLASIVWNGLSGPSLWQRLQRVSDGHTLNKAVVMSPYFESPDRFDHGLLNEWLSSGLQVDLFVPFDQASSCVPRDEVKKLAKRYPRQLHLFGVRTGGRVLHGKLIGVMSQSRAWLLTGSANFTDAALKGRNVEVCLCSEIRRAEADGYLDRLLLADARPIAPDDLPIPKPVSTGVLPKLTGFLISAQLNVRHDCLTITLDRPLSELGSEPSRLILEISGQALPLESVTSVSGTAQVIKVKPASRYLQNPDGAWQLGVVILRTADGSTEDWRLIESDEVLDASGFASVPPPDLKTFVSSLLNPRSVVTQPSVGGRRQRGETKRVVRLNFEDMEGKLDQAYRFATSLEGHFKRVMTDPYTVYRWYGDWVRFADLLTNSGDTLTQVGCALISARLLMLLEGCLAKDADHSCQWIAQDDVFLNSVCDLYHLASASPGFSASTIAACLTGCAK